MTALQIVGVAMVGFPLAIFFIVTAQATGFLEALSVWVVAILFAVLMVVGVGLAVGALAAPVSHTTIIGEVR